MLFIYDSEQAQELREEIAKARACHGMVVLGVSASGTHFRSNVRALLAHDLLVVPTGLDRCTNVVERMRSIALTCGIDVENLTAYLGRAKYQPNSRPVAAAAVPPAQQHAAAGQSITT